MAKKSTILQIQRDFLLHLYDKTKSQIFSELTPYSKQEAVARLNIYRNNVFGNFFSVLDSIFEVTKKIIGEKKFNFLVEQYIKTYHSNNGNLNEYGEFFPQFLEKNLKYHKLNFLSDLAIVELAHYKSLFVKQIENSFSLKEFKKIPVEKFSDLTFTLNPSCILFSSKFPIYSIWDKEKKSTNKQGEFLIVANTGKPFVAKLSEIEFLLLIEIGEGKKLYQTYQKICKKIKKEFDIGKMLNHFIYNRIIIGFDH